jgi:hypothetical protein
MIESIRTTTGTISVDTRRGILLKAGVDGSNGKTDTSITYVLTIEQCHVLIHALARAIGGMAVEVQT